MGGTAQVLNIELLTKISTVLDTIKKNENLAALLAQSRLGKAEIEDAKNKRVQFVMHERDILLAGAETQKTDRATLPMKFDVSVGMTDEAQVLNHQLMEKIDTMEDTINTNKNLTELLAQSRLAKARMMHGRDILLADAEVQKMDRAALQTEFDDSVATAEEAQAQNLSCTPLCNPGLRERHWKEISRAVGVCVEPDPAFTLEKMLNFDIDAYVQEITEISDSAGKEHRSESSLDSQFAEWEHVIMEFKPCAQTGSHIVSERAVDEVQTLLDDHVIETQTIKGTPYTANFAGRINDWEEFLKGVQDIIDIWPKVQSVWFYLEPIFSSDGIMYRMPAEGALFLEVDKTLKEITAKCVAEPTSLVVCYQEQFKERLESANDKLEQVQKGLNDYLETKRLFFPGSFSSRAMRRQAIVPNEASE